MGKLSYRSSSTRPAPKMAEDLGYVLVIKGT